MEKELLGDEKEGITILSKVGGFLVSGVNLCRRDSFGSVTSVAIL